MTCVQKLQEVEGLPTANLAKNDAVRPVPEGSLEQVAYRYRGPSSLGLTSFQTNEIRVGDSNFRGVLDQQDSFLSRDKPGQGVEHGGFATACCTADEDVLPRQDVVFQTVG